MRVIEKALGLKQHARGAPLTEPHNPLPECAPPQRRANPRNSWPTGNGSDWGGTRQRDSGNGYPAWGNDRGGKGNWNNTPRNDRERQDRRDQHTRDERYDEIAPRNGRETRRDSGRRSRSHERRRGNRDGSTGRDSANTVSFSDQHGKGSSARGTNKRTREHSLHTNMCVSFGCSRVANKTDLCTWQFDPSDLSKEVKTVLHTCSACVKTMQDESGPPAKTMKVYWEDGPDLAVRDIQVMNPYYEVAERDVHGHTAPRSPSYPPGN